MDKINKTFASGEILTAESLNSIVSSINSVISDVAELESEDEDIGDATAKYTENGCTITGTGEVTIGSTDLFTKTSGVPPKLWKEVKYNTDTSKTLNYYWTISLNPNYLSLILQESAKASELDLLTSSASSYGPKAVFLSDADLSSLGYIDMAGSGKYISTLIYDSDASTYTLELSDSTGSTYKIDVTNQIKSFLTTNTLEVTGKLSQSDIGFYGVSGTRAENWFIIKLDDSGNDVELLVVIYYNSIDIGQFYPEYTKTTTVSVPVFIPNPGKSYLGKTIKINNLMTFSVSSIASGYTFGDVIILTQDNEYVCDFGSVSLTCFIDNGEYYWATKKRTYSTSAFNYTKFYQSGAWFGTPNTRVPDPQLISNGGILYLTIATSTTATTLTDIEKFLSSEETDDSGHKYNIYVENRGSALTQQVAYVSGVDYGEGAWYDFTEYLYQNASIISGKDLYTGSEYTNSENKTCYTLWHTAGAWTYGNREELIYNPDAWIEFSDIKVSIDETFTKAKEFYISGSSTTSYTPASNPGAIKVTATKVDEDICRKIWQNSPIAIGGTFIRKGGDVPYYENNCLGELGSTVLPSDIYRSVNDLVDCNEKHWQTDFNANYSVTDGGYFTTEEPVVMFVLNDYDITNVDWVSSGTVLKKWYTAADDAYDKDDDTTYWKQNKWKSLYNDCFYFSSDEADTYVQTLPNIIFSAAKNFIELGLTNTELGIDGTDTVSETTSQYKEGEFWIYMDLSPSHGCHFYMSITKGFLLKNYTRAFTIRKGLSLSSWLVYKSYDTTYNPGEPNYLIGNTGNIPLYVLILSPHEYIHLGDNTNTFKDTYFDDRIKFLCKQTPEGNTFPITTDDGVTLTAEPIVGKRTALYHDYNYAKYSFAIGYTPYLIQNHTHLITVDSTGMSESDKGRIVKIDVTLTYEHDLCKPYTYSFYQLL